jgi:hypothetical protein
MSSRGRDAIILLRRRIYEILERGSAGDPVSLLVDRGLVALIVVNLTAVALVSIPSLAAGYGVWFDLIEYGSLIVFTVEYALRLWIAVEHAPHSHLAASAARIKYILSAPGIIDLLAVLPFWFGVRAPTRPAGCVGAAHHSLSQDHPLLAGDALASRSALQRTSRTVRLPRDLVRYDIVHRRGDAPRRGSRAA